MTTTGMDLTIGITTRNRPDDLLRCVRSATTLGPSVREILVVDDASDPPAEPGLRAALPADYPVPVRVIRFDRPDGYIVARNRIAQLARTTFVLYLDDDAFLFDDRAVASAMELARADDQIAAVAFAQADAEGTAWQSTAQPSPATVPSQIPCYIGFAHLRLIHLFDLAHASRV